LVRTRADTGRWPIKRHLMARASKKKRQRQPRGIWESRNQ
jgi:hypothetical protein